MGIDEKTIRYLVDWDALRKYKKTPKYVLNQVKEYLIHPYGQGVKCMMDVYQSLSFDFKEDCSKLGIEKINIKKNIFANTETIHKLTELLYEKYRKKDGSIWSGIVDDTRNYMPSIDGDVERDIIEIRLNED